MGADHTSIKIHDSGDKLGGRKGSEYNSVSTRPLVWFGAIRRDFKKQLSSKYKMSRPGDRLSKKARPFCCKVLMELDHLTGLVAVHHLLFHRQLLLQCKYRR